MTWVAKVTDESMDAFVRNQLVVLIIDQGTTHDRWPVQFKSGEVSTWYTREQGDSTTPTRNSAPVELMLDKEAWREISDRLNVYFGNHGPSDYNRLREDFNVQRAELAEANRFIRESLGEIISRRKRPTQ